MKVIQLNINEKKKPMWRSLFLRNELSDIFTDQKKKKKKKQREKEEIVEKQNQTYYSNFLFYG